MKTTLSSKVYLQRQDIHSYALSIIKAINYEFIRYKLIEDNIVSLTEKEDLFLISIMSDNVITLFETPKENNQANIALLRKERIRIKKQALQYAYIISTARNKLICVFDNIVKELNKQDFIQNINKSQFKAELYFIRERINLGYDGFDIFTIFYGTEKLVQFKFNLYTPKEETPNLELNLLELSVNEAKKNIKKYAELKAREECKNIWTLLNEIESQIVKEREGYYER